MVNAEIKQAAEHVLLEAFRYDFSALVNNYLRAAEGLGLECFELRLGEKANVFGRDITATGESNISIWTQDKAPRGGSTGFIKISEALGFAWAFEVYVRGEKVFERRDGEWCEV